jgi:hypothetical protein
MNKILVVVNLACRFLLAKKDFLVIVTLRNELKNSTPTAKLRRLA